MPPTSEPGGHYEALDITEDQLGNVECEQDGA